MNNIIRLGALLSIIFNCTSCEDNISETSHHELLIDKWWTTDIYCNTKYNFSTYSFNFYSDYTGLRTVPKKIDNTVISYDTIEIEWYFSKSENLNISNLADTLPDPDPLSGIPIIQGGAKLVYDIELLEDDKLIINQMLVSGSQNLDSCLLIDKNLTLGVK